MQQDVKIGFIGLGAMGFGMAASLCRAGFAVTGYDLRDEALTRLVEHGGARAGTPEGAATGAQLLFVMVVNDAQVEGGPVRRARRRCSARVGRNRGPLEHGAGRLRA